MITTIKNKLSLKNMENLKKACENLLAGKIQLPPNCKLKIHSVGNTEKITWLSEKPFGIIIRYANVRLDYITDPDVLNEFMIGYSLHQEDNVKVDMMTNTGECSICLESMTDVSKIVITHCQHVFHYDCLCLNVECRHECPLCRELLFGNIYK
jgi:hypothetical protein